MKKFLIICLSFCILTILWAIIFGGTATKDDLDALDFQEKRYARLTFAVQFRELTEHELIWCTDFLVDQNYSDYQYAVLMAKIRLCKDELLEEWIETVGW